MADMTPDKPPSGIKVREYCETLAESMETVTEVRTWEDLVRRIQKTTACFTCFAPADHRIHVDPYRWGKPIDLNTHVIYIDGYGVWGFADGLIEKPLVTTDAA